MDTYFFEEKEAFARQERMCYHCGGPIERWDKYIKTERLDERGFVRRRYHPECLEQARPLTG